MKRLTMALSLAPAVALGTAAAIDGVWQAAHASGRSQALSLGGAVVGGLLVLASVLWLRWGLSSSVERLFRGSRRTSTYFVWFVWTAVFSALAVRLAAEFGRPAALAMGAVVARIAAERIDLAPRLIADPSGLRASLLLHIPFAQLEGYQLLDAAAPGMCCLRLAVKGEQEMLEFWLAPTEGHAARRLFTSRKVAAMDWKAGDRRPVPPAL